MLLEGLEQGTDRQVEAVAEAREVGGAPTATRSPERWSDIASTRVSTTRLWRHRRPAGGKLDQRRDASAIT